MDSHSTIETLYQDVLFNIFRRLQTDGISLMVFQRTSKQLFRLVSSYFCQKNVTLSLSLEFAAANNYLNIIKWFYYDHYPHYSKMMCLAGKYGHIQIMEWLYSKDLFIYFDVLYVAIVDGRIDVCKWIFQRKNCSSLVGLLGVDHAGKKKLDKTLEDAVQNDQLDVLKLLVDKGIIINKTVYDTAFYCGRIKIIEWFHSQKISYPASDVIGLSLMSYNLDTYESVQKLGYNSHYSELYHATKNGDLLYIKEHSRIIRFNSIGIACIASRYGHVKILEWLKMINSKIIMENIICEHAAVGGHIEVLQWYVDNGFKLIDVIGLYAIYYHQPECFKWLKQHGVRWDNENTRIFIKNDKLFVKHQTMREYLQDCDIVKEILKWSRESNNQWSDDVKSYVFRKFPEFFDSIYIKN